MAFLSDSSFQTIVFRLWQKRLSLIEKQGGIGALNSVANYLATNLLPKKPPHSALLIENKSQLSQLDRLLTGEDGSPPFPTVFSGRFEGCHTHLNVSEETSTAPKLLKEAMAIIGKYCPEYEKALLILCPIIAPIRQPEERPLKRRCFTHAEIPLIQFISFTERLSPWTTQKSFERLALAVDLVHELGHHTLYLYQHADTIFESGSNTLLYSPIRRTKRPAALTLHAIVAVSFMLRLLTRFAASRLGNTEEQNYAKHSIRSLCETQLAALHYLNNAALTPLGTSLYKELTEQIREVEEGITEKEENNAPNYFTYTYA